MRSIYFLAKNRILHSTSFKELIVLQVLKGDEKHLSEGPSNAQYTSRFSARLLIEGIDNWIKRKLMCSLQGSARTSVLRKSYPSVAVNGKREEHFLTVLHVRSTGAVTIAETLQSFLQQKLLDLRKLIGQGYDGAATFAGKISGVHKQIQTSYAHAISIHCSCHRLDSLQFRHLHQ